MKVTSKPKTVNAVQFTGLESVKEMMDCFGRDFEFCLSFDGEWEIQISYQHDDCDFDYASLKEWVVMSEGGASFDEIFKVLTDAEFKKLYNQEG